MGKFLEYLIEDVGNEIKPADPHEIMTACFCAMSSDDFYKNDPNGMSKEEADEILVVLKDIAASKRIIGKNTAEIAGITLFKNKYDALAAAYSAAKAIRKNFKENTRYVILTGRSWHSDVEKYSGIENLKKFGIDSYGMKDFNSSDIILTNKSNVHEEAVTKQINKFLGVSLKKKGAQEKAADPTMLNRSVEDALGINDKIKKEVAEAFNDFYNKTIAANIDKLLPDNNSLDKMFDNLFAKSQKKGSSTPFKSAKTPKEIKEWLKKKCKNPQGEDWKLILSDKLGLMSAHPSKDNVRSVFNDALKRKGSVFEKLQKVINDNSDTIAYALLKIIYKGDLYKLIKNDFDFGVCIGKGSFTNKKCVVKEAEYESITTIENIIDKLRKSGKPNMSISEKQKPFDENQTAAKLFFDLNIDSHPLANIEVRYKGSFTSSPQFFATMSPEFKKYITTGEW